MRARIGRLLAVVVAAAFALSIAVAPAFARPAPLPLAEAPVAIPGHIYDPNKILGANLKRVDAALTSAAKDGASVYVAIVKDTASSTAQQWSLDTLKKSDAPSESYLLLIIPTDKQMWYLATPGPNARLAYADLSSLAVDTVVPALNSGNISQAVTAFNDAVQKASSESAGWPLWALILVGIALGTLILGVVYLLRRRRRAPAPSTPAPATSPPLEGEVMPPLSHTPRPIEEEDRPLMADARKPKKKRRFFARRDDDAFGIDAPQAPATADMWSNGAQESRDDLTQALLDAGITDPDLLARVDAAAGSARRRPASPAAREAAGQRRQPPLPRQPRSPRQGADTRARLIELDDEAPRREARSPKRRDPREEYAWQTHMRNGRDRSPQPGARYGEEERDRYSYESTQPRQRPYARTRPVGYDGHERREHPRTDSASRQPASRPRPNARDRREDTFDAARPTSVREARAPRMGSAESNRRRYLSPATSSVPRISEREITKAHDEAEHSFDIEAATERYLDQMTRAAATTGMTPQQVELMRSSLDDAARKMAMSEAESYAKVEEDDDIETIARREAEAELEQRRAERARAERERREAEERARAREADRARREAEERARVEAEARSRAEEEARQAAAEQRRRREAEAERQRELREARRRMDTESRGLPAAPAPRRSPAQPQRFAHALREADTLCRTREGALEVVQLQFGKDNTAAYAKALAQARRVVTEGLEMFADAQLNKRPLSDDGYLAHLADAVDNLRDQAERFAGWRHSDSEVDDVVADLEEFFAEAERGLTQLRKVVALIESSQPDHADALEEDADRAEGLLAQARDLIDQARDADAEGDRGAAAEATEKAERCVLDAVLVAHRIEDWNAYAHAQRTRDAAADLDTGLRYTTEAVVCYMAALEDFISLHRGEISLAARTMLMLANRTLTRADHIEDPGRALRLVEQAEQQAEQANRLALGSLYHQRQPQSR
ncbi:MAG: TPM domain-containing protein [Actinomycetaceae bacterium]|nr:TPM domain-containing protein [Actinomycetaceae bacterium]